MGSLVKCYDKVMSNILIATLGGLGALVLWGLSDWMAARSSKQYDVFSANLAIQIPGIFIMGVVLLFSQQKI